MGNNNNNRKEQARITVKQNYFGVRPSMSFDTIDYDSPYTDFISRMLIDPEGNVGIGTTTPGQKLEVNGTVKSNSILTGTNLSLNTAFGGNFINSGSGTTIRFGAPASYVQNVSVQGTLKADSSIQCGSNSNAASAALVGSQRYRTNGNNSYVDVCMQTGASTYMWVNIVTNNW